GNRGSGGRLAREADDRDLAIGHVLVAPEAVSLGGHAPPGDRTLLGPQELRPDLDPVPAHLDPDLVRVAAEVDEPPRVLRGTTIRGDDEPPPVAVVEAPEVHGSSAAGASADRQQQEAVATDELAGRQPVEQRRHECPALAKDARARHPGAPA